MKFCMVIAGNSEFYANAVKAADKLGYVETGMQTGMHCYGAGNGDKVNIAIIDMEASRTKDVVEQLEELSKDRQLMLLGPTPEDTARMKEMLGDFPRRVAIMPFSSVA